MPFPIAPLMAGLGSALNFFGNQSNLNAQAAVSRENTDKTIAANKASAELAYQRDMAQWNRSNEYNAPSAQMARLKSAGLNPMLAYGSGSVAGNSAAQSPSMGTPQANYQYQAKQLAPMDLMSISQATQQYELTKAQTDNVKMQTSATQQKINNDIIQNTLLQIEKQLKEENVKSARTTNLYLEKEKLLDLLIKNTQQAGLSQDISQKGTMFDYDLQYKKGAIDLQQKQSKKLLSDIKLQGFQGLKTQQDTKLSAHQTDNAAQDTKLKKIELLIKDEDRIEKAYNNWLREIGTAPDDNPLKNATRTFSRFMHWLMNDATEGQIENW